MDNDTATLDAALNWYRTCVARESEAKRAAHAAEAAFLDAQRLGKVAVNETAATLREATHKLEKAEKALLQLAASDYTRGIDAGTAAILRSTHGGHFPWEPKVSS